MRSLSRAVTRSETGAAVVPTPYRAFTDKQIAIRRGEVSMIAGPPGAGKSTLALDFSIKARVPTLYLSADTHAHTMSLRTLAALTGRDQQQVEEWMDDPVYGPAWSSDVLSQVNHIRWCFESAPSLRDLEWEVDAFVELYGVPPQLIVFDNLIDATFEQGDEYGSMRALLREFKWWARETDAAFLVLHHTSESVPGNPCPPRSALHGKVAQTPALILTVTSQDGFLGVAPVKNRYGPANASGSDVTWLTYDPARMAIDDLPER